MTEREIQTVKQLYSFGAIRVLIVTHSHCWDVADLQSHVVVILDAEKYDGVEKRYTEYDIPSILQMQS
jgi:pre-mRNA-splicing helicase BRR2